MIKAPVRYEPVGSCIFDANDKLICDGIGWARTTLTGEDLGPFIADAINEKLSFKNMEKIGLSADVMTLIRNTDTIVLTVDATPPLNKRDMIIRVVKKLFTKWIDAFYKESGRETKTGLIVHFSDTKVSSMSESEMAMNGWYREKSVKFSKSLVSMDTITLFCDGKQDCHDQGFKKVKADSVNISLDLKTDEYVFTATCPQCNGKIYNRRKAF